MEKEKINAEAQMRIRHDQKNKKIIKDLRKQIDQVKHDERERIIKIIDNKFGAQLIYLTHPKTKLNRALVYYVKDFYIDLKMEIEKNGKNISSTLH